MKNYLTVTRKELEVFIPFTDTNNRAILEAIHIRKNMIEATNGYSLIQKEIKDNTLEKDIVLPIDVIKKLDKKAIYQLEIDSKLSLAIFRSINTNDVIQCGLMTDDYPVTDILKIAWNEQKVKEDNMKFHIGTKQLDCLVKSAKKAKREVIDITIYDGYRLPVEFSFGDNFTGFIMKVKK